MIGRAAVQLYYANALRATPLFRFSPHGDPRDWGVYVKIPIASTQLA